jgi:hypothetical protein
MNVYRTVAKVNSFFRAFPVFRLAFGQTQSIDGNSIFINTMIDEDRR